MEYFVLRVELYYSLFRRYCWMVFIDNWWWIFETKVWNLIKFAALSTCLRGVIEYTTCLASAQDKGEKKKEDWGLGPPPHSHSSVFLFSQPPPPPPPPSPIPHPFPSPIQFYACYAGYWIQLCWNYLYSRAEYIVDIRHTNCQTVCFCVSPVLTRQLYSF